MGLINPEKYLEKRMSAESDIPSLLLELKRSNFGGKEMEIFEAIQNMERQLLQKKSNPTITGGGWP